MARGEAHSNAKLSEDTVREIRTVYAKGGVRMKDLASQYGVSFGAIQAIIAGRTWKGVA